MGAKSVVDCVVSFVFFLFVISGSESGCFLFEDCVDGSVVDEATETVCEASGSLRDDAHAP